MTEQPVLEVGTEQGTAAKTAAAPPAAPAPPDPPIPAAIPAATPPSTPPSAPPAAPAPSASSWMVPLLVLVAGMFMSVLDISIVNVAIPTMQNDFGVDVSDIQWVSTAYSLAEGVVVPASAWLGLRFGLGRCYIWSLSFFAVASALCGFAWDLNSMIVFRVLQAIPGGVIPVMALTMLYKVVPKERLGAAMGIYGLGVVFAPGMGPTLGGYLVEYVDWRLIFFINIPIAVVGVAAAIRYLPSFPGGRAHRFDVPGFLAVASGLFALLIALDEGDDWGWTSYPVLMLAVYGVLALALFVVIELETEHPLLNVRAFLTPAFSISLATITVIMVGMFGVLFFVPQSLQVNQGLGAFETGLVLLPQAVAMAVIMPFAGQIFDRIGARWPVVIGLTICAWASWLLSDVTADTSHTELAWLLALRAAGMGIAMMPAMSGGIAALPPERVDDASAINTVVQRAASAIGLAGLTALMTGFQAQGVADRSGLMSGAGEAGASGVAGAPGADAAMLEQYSTSLQLQSHAFDTGFANLMIITTALTALGAVLGVFLPSGKPAGGTRVVEM